jgi:hypothetical protein
MLNKVAFRNYRGFVEFSLPSLSRVNLILGMNNSGKSAILEGIGALASDDPTRIFSSLYTRGERFREDRYNRPEIFLNPMHLFYGHKLEVDTELWISGYNSSVGSSLSCKVIDASADDLQPDLDYESGAEPDSLVAGQLALQLTYNGANLPKLNLNYQGGISAQDVRKISPRPINRRSTDSVRIVSTDSLDSAQVAELWSDVALTDDEARVTDAMKILEPSLERIAHIGSIDSRAFYSKSREGIVLKLADAPTRIPIGSMGDGMWRLLSLTLSAVRCAGGVLLVDEIDTGLHYSTLTKMWKLILDTANRLDIQVFATTHSIDCVRALAATSEHSPFCQDIMVHRVERGKKMPVSFDGSEVVAAVQQDLEIR